MANHQKPTKKELQANADAALAKLETLPLEDVPVDPPAEVTPPVDPPIDNPPADTPPEDVPVDPPAEVTPPVDPNANGKVDYKKKFVESSKEAQRLASTNKEINTAVQQASELPEPTTEELTREYPEWADMTPTEQRLAKDNLVNKRKFDLIHTATSKVRQQDEWNDTVIKFVEDPKVLVANPELEGKTDEFIIFATEKERRGNDLQTLILAFNAVQAKKPVVQHKGNMFPTGQGGGAAPVVPVDDGKISVMEGRALMKSDYKKWKEMLKNGKIRSE